MYPLLLILSCLLGAKLQGEYDYTGTVYSVMPDELMPWHRLLKVASGRHKLEYAPRYAHNVAEHLEGFYYRP